MQASHAFDKIQRLRYKFKRNGVEFYIWLSDFKSAVKNAHILQVFVFNLLLTIFCRSHAGNCGEYTPLHAHKYFNELFMCVFTLVSSQG